MNFELKPGWLARALNSAREEIKTWSKKQRDLFISSKEFEIKPISKRIKKKKVGS